LKIGETMQAQALQVLSMRSVYFLGTLPRKVMADRVGCAEITLHRSDVLRWLSFEMPQYLSKRWLPAFETATLFDLF
jgi:hypothetical protein